MCKSAVTNPWTGISWSNTIAPCDKKYFDDNFGSPLKYEAYINRNDFKKPEQKRIELSFNCLPEPFSGDKDSPVYCLNKNPGEPVPAFQGNAAFEKLTQENLNHSLKESFWAQKGRLTLPDGTIHGGVDWFEKKTKSLRHDLKGRTPNLFLSITSLIIPSMDFLSPNSFHHTYTETIWWRKPCAKIRLSL